MKEYLEGVKNEKEIIRHYEAVVPGPAPALEWTFADLEKHVLSLRK